MHTSLTPRKFVCEFVITAGTRGVLLRTIPAVWSVDYMRLVLAMSFFNNYVRCYDIEKISILQHALERREGRRGLFKNSVLSVRFHKC